ISFAAEGSTEWSAAPYNRPLTDGDRLWTDGRARAELDTGNALVRMDGRTSLILTEVDDDAVQLNLTQGTLSFRIGALPEGDRFEVDTPNLAFVASQPGEYRIDVDPANGSTAVSVLSGGARLYGERGESADVIAGQRLVFSERGLNPVAGVSSVSHDAFDQWVASRNTLADQSTTARYVSPGTVGYQQLDQYGNWQTDSSNGAVWYPSSVPAGWAPYRNGQWSYIEPWGWTWVDDAPWGFAPFHYGRWVQTGSRWGWAPGPRVNRAYYAPALVAFGGAGNVHWQINSGSGATWFPLGPGEPWRPGYSASDRYIDRINHGIRDGRGRFSDRYAYAGRPGAFTSIDGDRWDQRRPVRVGRDGFFEPPRAPFVLPPGDVRGPWAGRDPSWRGRGDGAGRDGRDGGDRRDRGDRGNRGDRSQPAWGSIERPIPLKPALVNEPTYSRPPQYPNQPQPARQPREVAQPQTPAQREVLRDYRAYQQQEAQRQQGQRQYGDQQRGMVGQQQESMRRQIDQSRQQEAYQQQQQRQQQDQLRQQQESGRQQQMRQQQAQQQQQYQVQRQQQQQQQQIQAQQQQRIQQEQMQRQQQQTREQAQQQQTQQRVLRDYNAYQRQEQRTQQIREQQMRGQVPP
ncbi:MAG: DUF6600 domain-containing protein, partial [Burkholderiales bacterium]